MRQRASTDGWPPHREPEFPARKPSGQCILDVLRNLQPALTTRLFGVNLPKNARSAEGDPKAPEVVFGEAWAHPLLDHSRQRRSRQFSRGEPKYPESAGPSDAPGGTSG